MVSEERSAGTFATDYLEGLTVIRLLGEHDMATVGELAKQILRAISSDSGVVVSLTEAEFIDSTVANTLFRADELLRAEAGRRLVLHVNTAAIVRRVLTISGLAEAVPCTGSLETAMTLALIREGDPKWNIP